MESDNAEQYATFLKQNQYSKAGILKYEFIFGEGFISTGGASTTEKISKYLELRPADRVLDVGCGIGGGAAYVAKANAGCHVTGIDLMEECIAIAQERHRGCDSLEFNQRDCMTMEEDITYHAIYSRDVLMHIEDKNNLFKKMYRLMKPGGKLVITDYCCGPKDKWTPEFDEYVKNRQYFLLTTANQKQLLENAGFEVERASDESSWLKECINSELSTFKNKKSEFLEKFTEEDFNELEQGWEQKIKRIDQGIQVWGLFVASRK